MPQQNIGTTGVELFPRSPYRRSMMFHNKSVNNIYIDVIPFGGIKTTNAGIIIPAGSARWFNWWEDGERDICDAWSAIADGADSTLVYHQFIGSIPTIELVKALQKTGVVP